MRIDKYLQLSRIVKQRHIAKVLCDSNKIRANGTPVKASHAVKMEDVIEIEMFAKRIRVKIVEIPTGKNVSKQKAKELYILEKRK